MLTNLHARVGHYRRLSASAAASTSAGVRPPESSPTAADTSLAMAMPAPCHSSTAEMASSMARMSTIIISSLSIAPSPFCIMHKQQQTQDHHLAARIQHLQWLVS